MVVLTALIGTLTYAVQKSVNRRTALVEMRRAFYAEFLDLFARAHLSRGAVEADIRSFGQVRFKLYAVGSDDVIRAFGDLNEVLNSVPRGEPVAGDTFDDVRRRLSRRILAMRADCFEASALTVEEVARRLPLRSG